MIERRRPIGPTPPMTMRGRQSGSTGATGSDRPSRPTARFDRRQRNTQLRLIGQPPVPQLHSLQFACGLTLASASAATTAAPPKREAGRVPAAGSLPLLPRQRPSGHHGRHCRATPRQPSSQQNSPMRRTKAKSMSLFAKNHANSRRFVLSISFPRGDCGRGGRLFGSSGSSSALRLVDEFKLPNSDESKLPSS